MPSGVYPRKKRGRYDLGATISAIAYIQRTRISREELCYLTGKLMHPADIFISEADGLGRWVTRVDSVEYRNFLRTKGVCPTEPFEYVYDPENDDFIILQPKFTREQKRAHRRALANAA